MKVTWTEQAWEPIVGASREWYSRAHRVDNYRIVYRRTPKAVEVLTVFEGHRLLRPDELLTGD